MAVKKPGTYAPLSSYYFDDVAIMEAGEDAELLYIRMLAYASRQVEMEGFIPAPVVQSRLGILPRSGNGTGTDTGNQSGTDALSRAETLCDVGLLERVDGGYQIRSWLRWNKTAEEADKVRTSDRKRKQQVADGLDIARSGNGTGKRSGNGTGKGPGSSDQKQNTETETKSETDHYSEEFEEWWKHYPIKNGKAEALPAFIKARKKASLETLTQAVIRYSAWLKTTTTSPKYAQGWLNKERWTDELTFTQPLSQARPTARREAAPPEVGSPQWKAIYGEQ